MIDVEALKKAPVAILGGGAVGKTCGADCALAGQEVRICDLDPFFEKTLGSIMRTGITLQDKAPGTQTKYGFRRMGKAHFAMATNSVAECVKGAKLIIVGIPSVAHEVFFKELIPCLEDGQIIHIIPDNYGSLKLRKMMREMNCTKKVIIGGWSSAPYGTRVDTEGGVMNSCCSLVYRAITLRGAALPAKDTEEFVESSKALGCFDAITEGDGAVCGDTVLDIGFSNVNPVIHVPGTVLGVSTMENFSTVLDKNIHDYSIYSHSSALPFQKFSMSSTTKKLRLPMKSVLVFSLLRRKFSSSAPVFLAKNIWAKAAMFLLKNNGKLALAQVLSPFRTAT